MRRGTLFAAAMALLIGGQAKADIMTTFDVTWSGAAFSNGASASGVIVLDTTVLPNPESGDNNLNFGAPYVQSFLLTITGAGAGNGTFNISDFNIFYWNTNGATLNLSQQLVGQPTPGTPWGTLNQEGDSGDFTIFSNGVVANAPTGTNYFTLQADNGSAMKWL